MLAEGLTCAINGCHMGITAEEIVRRYGVSRADQDAFRRREPARAGAAIDDGRVRQTRSSPVEVPQRKGAAVRVDKDEYPRPGTTAEKLAALKPAFTKDGTVTAGNASASTTARPRWWSRRTRRRASARHAAARTHPVVRTHRRRPDDHGHGTGAGDAQGRATRARLSLADLDLFELNEAFAAQSLAVSASWPRPQGSTSTAAPSRSAIRSAPAAPAC